jgi:hypothetical protein
MEYIKLKEVNTFQINKFVSKKYQKWDDEQKKYINSDVPMAGLSPVYTFEITVNSSPQFGPEIAGLPRMLQLSSNQFSQCLLSAFDLGKPYTEINFQVKTNGQTGKEIRYWINPVYMPIAQDFKKTSAGGDRTQNTPNTPQTGISGLVEGSVSVDEIPF